MDMDREKEYVEGAAEETVVMPALDIEAIGDKYEEKGYFTRLRLMFKGLGMPRDTAEYKLARTELQRQTAPLVAVVSVVLLVVVLIVVTSMTSVRKDQFEVTVAEAAKDVELEEQQDEETPDDIEPPEQEVEIQVDTVDPGPVSEITPQVAPPAEQVTVKPATQDTVAFVDSPVKMKSMTGSRTPGSIGAMTNGGAGYGDAITEATVMKVLWWLKATQNANGSWGYRQEWGKDTSNARPYFIASTAFAVLTYLAHGEYPNSPSKFRKDFGPVVEKALEFLVTSVNTDNGVVRVGDPVGGKDGSRRTCDANEYTFLIATYALCEAYGMTKNPDCKEAAMKCLERIVKGQSPTGGWDYKINPKSTRDDLSFAGWALQALKAGKMAGLHPDGLDSCINKAIKCLKTRNFHKDHFTYCAGASNHPGLTATGCLAMQLLGYGAEPEVRASLNYMKDWQPAFKREDLHSMEKKPECPQYYCYYATQCKYQAGMKTGATKGDEATWKNWNAAMKRLYPKTIKELPAKVKDWTGKEHKQGYYRNIDTYSTRPVMDSCLVALQLMVYYRYLPTTSLAAGAETGGKIGGDDKPAADDGDVGVVVDF